MAVNHFAPFLLTLQMLEGPHAGTLRRIVNVSSMAHLSGRLDLTDPGFVRRRFDAYQAYAASKLANVFHRRARASARGVRTHGERPSSGSRLDQAAPRRLWNKGSDSLQEGATTSVFLAVDPSVATLTGRYFDRCQETRAPRLRATPIGVAGFRRERGALASPRA